MKQLNKIIVALGTNIDQKKNALTAEAMMKTIFKDSYVSKHMWTKPVNMKSSEKFLNFIIFAKTQYGLTQLTKAFKQLEKKCGRTKYDESRGIIKIDIDILQYGDKIFHEEDWNRDYVKELMLEDPYKSEEETITREKQHTDEVKTEGLN